MAAPDLNAFAQRYGSIAVLALSLLALYVVGIQGLFKAAPLGDDFRVFYRAGSLFAEGRDPWLSMMDTSQPFSYPPHAVSVLSAYTVFPEHIALGLHIVVSLLSIAVLCYCANRWFLHIGDFRHITLPQSMALGLIIGNPYTATSLYQGQMTLAVTAALSLSFLLLQEKKRVAAGILLAIATLKPQLAIFYILWLLLSLELGVLLVGGVVAALCIIPASIILGPLTPMTSWLASLHGYADVAINMPGSPYVAGFESLLAAHGLYAGALPFAALGAIVVITAFLLCRWMEPFMALQLLLVTACSFLFVHDYDYVAVILVWSCALYLAFREVNWGRIATFVVLAVPFFMPQRLIRDIELPAIVHARTLILVVIFAVFVLWRLDWEKRSAQVMRAA